MTVQPVPAASAAPGFNHIGVLTVGIGSSISALAVFVILLALGLEVVLYVRRRRSERPFVMTHLGVFTALFFAGLEVLAVGGALDWMWFRAPALGNSAKLCTTQALFLQFGNMSTAFLIFYIAGHVFTALILRRRLPWWGIATCLAMLYSILAFLEFVGIIFTNSTLSRFYAPATSWCWIAPTQSEITVMAVVAIPIVVSAGLSLMVFAVTMVLQRRRITPALRAAQAGYPTGLIGAINLSDAGGWSAVKYLVWWPAVYTIFTLPLAITVLMGTKSVIVNIAMSTLYSLVGTAFVILFVLTHKATGGKALNPTYISESLHGSVLHRSAHHSLIPVDKGNLPHLEIISPVEKEWRAPKERTPRSEMADFVTGRSSPTSTVYTVATDFGSQARPPPPLPVPMVATLSEKARKDSLDLIRGHAGVLSSSTRPTSPLNVRPQAAGSLTRSGSVSGGSVFSGHSIVYPLSPSGRQRVPLATPIQPVLTTPPDASTEHVHGIVPPPQIEEASDSQPGSLTSSQKSLFAKLEAAVAEPGRELQPALDAALTAAPEPMDLRTARAAQAAAKAGAVAPTEPIRDDDSARLRSKESMAALAAALDLRDGKPLPPQPARLADSTSRIASTTYSDAPSSAYTPSPPPSASLNDAHVGVARRVPAPAHLEPTSARLTTHTSNMDDYEVPTPIRDALFTRARNLPPAGEDETGYRSDGGYLSEKDHDDGRSYYERTASIIGYYGRPSPGTSLHSSWASRPESRNNRPPSRSNRHVSLPKALRKDGTFTHATLVPAPVPPLPTRRSFS